MLRVQREDLADVLFMFWASSSARGQGRGGARVAGTDDGDSSRDLAALWETGCGVHGDKYRKVEQEGDQGYSRDLRSRRCAS